MRSMWMWTLVGLLACAGKDPVDSAPEGADSGTPPGTDTEDTEDTAPIPLAVTALSAELVPDLGPVPRVRWEQSHEGTATLLWSFDGEFGGSPAYSLPAGEHSQLILGVPYGVEVTWWVLFESGDERLESEPQTISTPDWPETLPVPQLLTSNPDGWDPTLPYVLTSLNQSGDERTGDWWVFILDRKGRVLWSRFTPTDWVSRYVRIGVTGRDILIDYDSYWSQGAAGIDSRVWRMQLDGELIHEYLTPGLHHSFTELPDGRVVWLALENTYTNEILRVVDDAGQVDDLWNCQEQFVGRSELSGLFLQCGTNGLYYSEPRDTFLVSSWALDTVIEVEHATGNTVRYFGQADGAWDFDPPESEFDWQHGPIYTDDGNLMVSSKRYDAEAARYETVVYEYEVDEAEEALREVWSFGKGEGIYGMYMGEVHRLPGGNTLHNYGEESRLREVTPAGEIVWEVWWEGDEHIGRSTPFEHLYDLAPPPT